MIDNQNLRSQFSHRLHQALDARGIRSHGRGADILAALKQAGVVKTAQAVSKWLNGAAIPEVDSLTALAEWLRVRREWLEHGVLPVKQEQPVPLRNTRGDQTENRTEGLVPLLTFLQVVHSNGNREQHSLVEKWIPCPVEIGQDGFALVVTGDSMTHFGLGKSYPPGCIIFVDPDCAVEIGDRVVAKAAGANHATFKVLAADAGKTFLKPINPQYPIVEVDALLKIYGKVIGTFIAD